MKKKVVALIVAMVLCVGIGIGGTIAWLTSTTGTIENVFSVGNVKITLDETNLGADAATNPKTTTGNSYHLVPGNSYDKDPIVHVDKDSEACYVFIKVENGLSAYEAVTDPATDIASQIAANGWLPVDATNYPGYYYTTASPDGTADIDLDVFEKFTIGNVDLTGADTAKITVQACAIQSSGFANAAAAFAGCPGAFTGITTP